MSSEKIVHPVHWWGEGWGGSSRYICLNLFYISPNICWRSVEYVSSEKKEEKKKISILKSSHIIGFILSLFFGNYIINEIKKAKGKLCWERENICAKVCQHLAFGGLETTLSKFEHRLLPKTATKLSRILAQRQKYEYFPEYWRAPKNIPRKNRFFCGQLTWSSKWKWDALNLLKLHWTSSPEK